MLSGVNRPGLIEARRPGAVRPPLSGYPGLIAPASLKLGVTSMDVPTDQVLSGVNRPGLIEAVVIYSLYSSPLVRYPGLIAPASLKHCPYSFDSAVQRSLSGVNRPGLIEAICASVIFYSFHLVIRG